MTTIYERLRTRVLESMKICYCVGSDELGNRYYEKKVKSSRPKRWVLYKGHAEGSKVPPLWHAWLHHTLQDPPTEGQGPSFSWQKPHIPNLTGTKHAYKPYNTVKKPSYEAWTPDENSV